MTLQFRFHVPAGTRLANEGHTYALYPTGEGNIRAEDLETGRSEVWTLQEYLARSQRPGASRSNLAVVANDATARIRAGGRFHRDQLSVERRDEIDFRKALCLGVEELMKSGVRVRVANLDKPEHREFVRDVARLFYTVRPIHLALRGGSIRSVAIMPKGRTMFEYWQRFVESGGDEMALADQTWLRGNHSPRIPHRVRELITRAIEDVGLDTKKPTPASVCRRAKDLVVLENVKRDANGLQPLAPVSHKTVSAHMKALGATALAIARDGERAAVNARTRGRADTRAQMIGELVEIDECKLSLILIVKRIGLWQRLTDEELQALDEIEDYVRTRLYLVLVLDVASRMPLGWVLTDAPSTEATTEALRMATRDKTREKTVYGCDLDPMPAIGLGCVVNDNGSGLRNSAVKTVLMGATTQIVDVRAYHSGDKPFVERMFGTMESRLINLLHGYTGRKAGHLKGYDAVKSAAFIREELYSMITKYLIDEYPSEVHYGTTFFGQRPAEAMKKLAAEGWVLAPMSPQDRRLTLGWRREATITDEGVKVFGLPYNSPELQRFRDSVHRKVAVYLDPDCINDVTVVVEGYPEYVVADLSWTAMRDMTLPEFLAHVEAVRARDPAETRNFDLRLAQMRQERFDMLRRKAVEHDLPRSYMTIEEVQRKADKLTRGMHAYRPPATEGTVRPGSIGNLGEAIEGVYDIEEGFPNAIEGEGAATPEAFQRPDTEGKLK